MNEKQNCDNCRYQLECRVNLRALKMRAYTTAPIHVSTLHCQNWTEEIKLKTAKEIVEKMPIINDPAVSEALADLEE